MIFPMKCNTFANSIASPSVYRLVHPAKFPVILMEHLVHRSPMPLIQIWSFVSVKRNPIHLSNLNQLYSPNSEMMYQETMCQPNVQRNELNPRAWQYFKLWDIHVLWRFMGIIPMWRVINLAIDWGRFLLPFYL